MKSAWDEASEEQGERTLTDLDKMVKEIGNALATFFVKPYSVVGPFTNESCSRQARIFNVEYVYRPRKSNNDLFKVIITYSTGRHFRTVLHCCIYGT